MLAPAAQRGRLTLSVPQPASVTRAGAVGFAFKCSKRSETLTTYRIIGHPPRSRQRCVKGSSGSHPRAHILVPGGCFSPDDWIACRPRFFLPVRILSRLFRRLLLEKLTALPSRAAGVLRRPGRPAASNVHLAAPCKHERVVYAKAILLARHLGGAAPCRCRFLLRQRTRPMASIRRSNITGLRATAATTSQDCTEPVGRLSTVRSQG